MWMIVIIIYSKLINKTLVTESHHLVSKEHLIVTYRNTVYIRFCITKND